MLLKFYKEMPRPWLIFFILFVLLQGLLWWKDRESMPFYMYGMYSAPMTNKSTLITHWEIKINGSKLYWQSLPNLAKVHVENNLQAYDNLLNSSYYEGLESNLYKQFLWLRLVAYMPFITQQLLPQKIALNDFKAWLIAYIQPYVKMPIEDIIVTKHIIEIQEGKMLKFQPIVLF